MIEDDNQDASNSADTTFLDMSDKQRHLILLGPQPDYASLRLALAQLNLRGPVALNTSGWETEEHEDSRLKEAIDSDSINLHLFARTEKLFAGDPELIQTLQARQDELRHLRRAYNDRLDHQLKAARQIIRRQENLIDLSAEREAAIEMIRQLDRQYLVRTSQIIDKYEDQLQTANRPLVQMHREEISRILDQVSAIIISGGHVAIILNRLKIFGILEMRPDIPIVAWSGGTMALADKVVFFHDSPPQGAGNPEVLRAGMGLFQDLLPLPHGRTRLNLQDAARVELFARRFDQYKCVILDQQTILERKDGSWGVVQEESDACLSTAGNVESFA